MDTSLNQALSRLASTLPPGSLFEFELGDDGLRLNQVRVPVMGQGTGTRFLAAVIAEADRHGLPIRLSADSTDEPGDPSNFELVRWYARFGFEVVGLDADEWIEMRREPSIPPIGPDGVLGAYAMAKDTDLTRDAYDETFARVAAHIAWG